MKLSDCAEKLEVGYRTAWRMFHKGHIPGAYRLPSGTIIVPKTKPAQVDRPPSVAVYCRVSSSQNKANLDSQCERLTQYCITGGYHSTRAVKEIGSGINDQRKRFLSLLGAVDVQIIVVEHQDRATRFGFNYIQTMLYQQNRRLEVVNKAENDKDELM